MADRRVDPGVLATVSTGVLSVATLLVAWAGRHDRLREWGWLVYPLLIGIGLKLVTQDFKHSRPATLFIALALYGAALILAPRLRRRVEKIGAQSGT
jgi:drug/metabolite transporter (DMT)-like permease